MEILLSNTLSKNLFTFIDQASYLSLFFVSKTIQVKNKKKIKIHDLVCCCFLNNYRKYRKFYKLNYYQFCKNGKQAFSKDHDNCLSLFSNKEFGDEFFKMEIESREICLEELLEESIKNNKIKIFKYLLGIVGNKADSTICNKIASKGRIIMLKYAHKKSYAWDHHTIYAAARRNHLDCLKYAHENGCIYSRTGMYYCKNISPEIQNYLTKHNMQNMDAPNQKRRRKSRLNQTLYTTEVNVNNQPIIVNVTKYNL